MRTEVVYNCTDSYIEDHIKMSMHIVFFHLSSLFDIYDTGVSPILYYLCFIKFIFCHSIKWIILAMENCLQFLLMFMFNWFLWFNCMSSLIFVYLHKWMMCLAFVWLVTIMNGELFQCNFHHLFHQRQQMINGNGNQYKMPLSSLYIINSLVYFDWYWKIISFSDVI